MYGLSAEERLQGEEAQKSYCWGSIASNFIVQLRKTKNDYDRITTYADKLSRRVHFVPYKGSDTAFDAANAFSSNLFEHHGMQDSTISVRHPKFTLKIWNRLTELCGVKMKISSSFHPQTDDSFEIMKRMVKTICDVSAIIIGMIGMSFSMEQSLRITQLLVRI